MEYCTIHAFDQIHTLVRLNHPAFVAAQLATTLPVYSSIGRQWSTLETCSARSTGQGARSTTDHCRQSCRLHAASFLRSVRNCRANGGDRSIPNAYWVNHGRAKTLATNCRSAITGKAETYTSRRFTFRYAYITTRAL